MGTNIKPQVDRFTLKNGKNIILLAEGRLDALSEPTKKKHKTALPSVLRPTVFDPGFWTPVFGPWFLTPHLSFPLILRGRAISSWFTSTKSKVSGASLSCCPLVKASE